MKRFSGLTFLAILISLFLFSASVSAEDSTTSSKFEQLKTKIQNRLEVKKEKILAKLDDKKLKVCEVKEKVITTREQHLTRLANNIFDKFDKITARVEEFYKTKLVPQGKTISNYDTLVSDIQTKKTAAQDALNSAKADSVDFSCAGDDPKGALKTFRSDMQTVKSALKDYRTAIKDLIVAVKGAVPAPTP